MLILASLSPRRKELLKRIAADFKIVGAACDEYAAGDCFYRELPFRNAELKANAVAEQFPASLVIGADTVIEFKRRIIGKPADKQDALNILLELSGQQHKVITAVAPVCVRRHLKIVYSEETIVRFKPFSRAVAETYLQLVDVLDKAGAYAVQEHSELIVESLDGDLDNVVGLPLGKLQALLPRYNS